MRAAICLAVAFALSPFVSMRRCPVCFQRRLRVTVAPHRNGQPGVFRICRSCGAKIHAW